MQTSFADIDTTFPHLTVSVPGMMSGDGTLFVCRLIYGSGHRDLCLEHPTWEQIISAISSLDGRYDVLLEGQNAFPYMVVGGRDGKYLVAVGQENSAYYLSDPQRWGQKPSLIVLGGQASEYEADLCVGGEMAMQAIWAFVEQGILLPSFRWVEDSLVLE